MKKVLVYYDEKFKQIADIIVHNYRNHDIYCEKICTTIQDDIEYAKKNGFSEAIFIEVNEKLVHVYIKSGYIFESGLDDGLDEILYKD